MSHITLATCSLNQWALDFDGNRARILESIRLAKEKGCSFRLGPELEISGYGCNDHFFEQDTYQHSLEVLASLLQAKEAEDIVCDVGMPVLHKGVRYNCRIIFFNHKIYLIRPKLFLAMGGNYREARWFTPWTKLREVEDFHLPAVLRDATGQTVVPFGDGVIETSDTCIGTESCEELFTPDSPHIHMGLDGVEIFTNGSGSHHELRKLNTRIDLIRGATSKSGGVYLYANQQGCDAERVYYDGCAMIACNGNILLQGSQFSLNEVEVVAATVNMDDVRSFRGNMQSRSVQAGKSPAYPRVSLPITLATLNPLGLKNIVTPPTAVRFHTSDEEIELGPACWLWDYLRRSGMSGYFLALSGGADSAAVACIVFSMCRQVHEACCQGNTYVLADVRRILRKEADYVPSSPEVLAHELLHTCYMGTVNSTERTESLAKQLATQIGAYHSSVKIDSICSAILAVFSKFAGGRTPAFKVHGGTDVENLALQNIQARTRMVVAYLFAQLLLWYRGKPGSLLVLGSANVDECLRGYLTKYDCSAADLNPIGSISKLDLRSFLRHFQRRIGGDAITSIVTTPASAELEPVTEDHKQVSEDDMGMSFEELSMYGRLRKISMCGPYTMFTRLCELWRGRMTATEVADKVKFFFRMYSINRHKSTVLPPAYHAESYSPDDNRFDLRPFLYNARWSWQFRMIDHRAAALAASAALEPTVASAAAAGGAAEVGTGSGAASAGAADAATPVGK